MMNQIGANACVYNISQMECGPPWTGTATVETLLPTIYGSVIVDSKASTVPIKSEGGLTYNNIQQSLTRKRSRETYSTSSNIINPQLYLQLQQRQEFDIEHLISQHMEKVRAEVEENRKRQARRIVEAIEEGMVKRLRAKEDEIQKIGKLNSALEQRVKSLRMENQIWRDLAQTNEAAANALRKNLEQVLADTSPLNDPCAAATDDEQSCCGSTGAGAEEEEVEERRMIASGAQDQGIGTAVAGMCRSCGRGGACVLLLPCRHLCLCTVCGSSLHTCPVCKSTKNASVHVSMS